MTPKIRRRMSVVGALLIVVAVAGWLLWTTMRQPDVVESRQDGSSYNYRVIDAVLGSGRFRLQVADTADKQELGLGRRPALGDSEGMVFPYAEPSQLCFWMKDMRFSIDMIWLDSAKKVIQIQPAVSPETYPQTYCSPQPARYVVEVRAEAASKAGITVGDAVDLPL